VITRGRRSVLGVYVDAVDYEIAVSRIISAAEEGRSLSVAALAVHGIMTGALDPVHRYRLNRFDVTVPDGQPVRWALNWLHRTGLPDRVYGPTLMLKVCEMAASRGLPVFLYGSRPAVLSQLHCNLARRCPGVSIAGVCPSKFRSLSAEEKSEVVRVIRNSGARLTLVALGCPRQEVWAYEYAPLLGMPVVAVGAAFDFHAGSLPQAPECLQRNGLEWLFRLWQEPRRLWRRYAYLNPAYAGLLLMQAVRLRQFDTVGTPPDHELGYG
jgi:N-acetylglucosaminyldiphosphoundecaprenol N-acetyl-beta-D-mannosaminyltransferase